MSPADDEMASGAAELKIGTKVAGYRLDEQIGRGGMAVVYRAQDEHLDRRVALKLLAPELARDIAFRTRFIRESRAAAAVDHPNIIPIYDAGDAVGVLFIAMRYVQGGDVRSLLQRLGPLPAAHACGIIGQVASALDTAHAHGLIHRDVKPANMLLDTGGAVAGAAPRPAAAEQSEHVYLSDFGISKQTVSTAFTATGQFVGTLDYVAPEQIEGRAVDGRTDLYALACTAFELLSGTPPFQHDQIMALLHAQVSEPPPALSARRAGLPAAVDGVLARALAKNPEERYPTCTQFAAELSIALGIAPGPRDRIGAPPTPDIAGAQHGDHLMPRSPTTEIAGPEPPSDAGHSPEPTQAAYGGQPGPGYAAGLGQAGGQPGYAGQAGQGGPGYPSGQAGYPSGQGEPGYGGYAGQGGPGYPSGQGQPGYGGYAGQGGPGYPSGQGQPGYGGYAGQAGQAGPGYPSGQGQPGYGGYANQAGPGYPSGQADHPSGQGQPWYGGYSGQAGYQTGQGGPGRPSGPQRAPKRRSGAVLTGVAVASVVVIVAAAVIIFVVLKHPFGGSPAAKGSDTSSSSASTSSTALSQATAVNNLLNSSATTRQPLQGVINQVAACSNLPGDVTQLQAVVSQRNTEYNHASALSTGALPNGAAVRSDLVSALFNSLAADRDYLTWARQQEQLGCTSSSQSVAYNQAFSADHRANTAKAAFVLVWNPIARQDGFAQEKPRDI